MSSTGKKHRGPKALVLLLVAIGGAVAVSGRDLKRYLHIRSM